jgi:formate transporter
MAIEAHALPTISFNAFSPKEVAERAQKAGVAKAYLGFWKMFALAILAGVFIGLGAEFCTLTITGISIGFGLTKLIGGIVFSLGLVLVVVAGAELFTGNNLLTIAWISRAIPTKRLLYNWGTVFLGNLVGSFLLAWLMFLTRQWTASDYGVGATAIKIAAGKTSLPFMTALVRGVLCNLLVCLAVWLCFSARSAGGKILAILFPITAFVASGFEHSVANMYFIPFGLLMKSQPQVVAAAGLSVVQLNHLTWVGFLGNLLPVTIGNVIGGGVMVGLTYWYIYLQKEEREEKEEPFVAPELKLLPVPKESVMKIKTSEPTATLLCSYVIATQDMFYNEMNQRVIYARDDRESGFRVWGEIPGGGGETAVDLCQVLLEYAMTCNTLRDLPKAYREIETFSKRLGESLAIKIMESTPAQSASHRAACGLECLFESMRVHFALQQHDGGLDYLLDHCPLCASAEQRGIHVVELAHHGLNALCITLIQSITPSLRMHLPAGPHANHIFSLIPAEAEAVRK